MGSNCLESLGMSEESSRWRDTVCLCPCPCQYYIKVPLELRVWDIRCFIKDVLKYCDQLECPAAVE